jgi:sugar phosphate permease
MASQQPLEKRRFAVLAVVCLLAVVTYVQRVGFAVVAPELQIQYQFNPRQMGFLLAAFLIAYGLFEVPCGWLGDKLGVRHLLTLLAIGMSISTALVVLVMHFSEQTWQPLAYLLIVRFAFGAFQAGIFPVLSRTMADWMPVKERGTAQGSIWMASRVGGAIAPFLIVWLVKDHGGWPAPLFFAAILGILWCIVYWPWYREPVVSMSTGRKSSHVAVPWRTFLRSRSVWGLCLMYACGGFVANFYVTLLPTYLRDQRHLAPDQMKWVTGLPLACGIVACLAGGLVSDAIIRTTGNRKWGRRLNGSIGLFVAAVSLLATNYVNEVWALASLLCLTFFCNDLAMGPAWASCADVGERHAGSLAGLMNMCGNLAGAVGSILAGSLFNAGMSSLVFVIFSSSFACAALCWLLVDATQPIESE